VRHPVPLGRIRSDFGTNLFLSLHIGSLFPTDALPVSVEGVYPVAMDFLVGGPGSPYGVGIASARVTSLTSAGTDPATVPEPTGLLALGLLMARRRRHMWKSSRSRVTHQ
jgi:MYXO-CTERM domain-containing protein